MKKNNINIFMNSVIDIISDSFINFKDTFFGEYIHTITKIKNTCAVEYDDFNINSIEAAGRFKNAFLIMSVEITKAGGITNKKILTVKNILKQLFDKNTAAIIIKKFNTYLELPILPEILEEYCENLGYFITNNSKVQIIKTLFMILKINNSYKAEELRVLRKIAGYFGLSYDEFQTLLLECKEDNYYETNNNSRDFTGKSINNYTTYFTILGINNDAPVDQIKKRYRELMKKYHPDVRGILNKKEEKKADIQYQLIRDAYDRIKEVKPLN